MAKNFTKAMITEAGKAIGAAKKALKDKPDDEKLKKALADAETELERIKAGYAEQEKANPAQKAKALKGSCSRDGFWRGGIQWFKEPKIVRLDDLTEEQVKLIRAEKRLSVEEVEIELPAESEE